MDGKDETRQLAATQTSQTVAGFVWSLENMESNGIIFFDSLPGKSWHFCLGQVKSSNLILA